MQIWPFQRKAAAPETKSLTTSSTWADLILGTTPTAAGTSVSLNTALGVPAVANAIQIISEACATLDVTVKRIEGKTEVDVPDHPLLGLLRGEVNGWTTSFEFIRDLVFDALTNNIGGMAWVNRIGGEPREIIRYTPGALICNVDPNTGERTYSVNSKPLSAQDVIHVLPPLGRCPLSLAREAIAVAVALEQHAAKLFSRGARPGGALTFQKGMPEEAVVKTRAAWAAAQETPDGNGRTVILYDGASFVPFTFNSTDAQFLENRRFQVLEIARAFNIPAPMIGDLERATWSNSEQKGREFLSYCLEPWLRALEGALARALFTEDERQDHVIRFDRDDLTRADLSTRATVINSLIASKTINPNEGRSWIGLPPRDGGDEFSNPNITEGSAPNPADPSRNSADTPEAEDGNEPE